MHSLERVTGGLARAGQSHVLQFWPELCEAERAGFLQELSQLDLPGLRDHCEGAARAAAATAARLDRQMEPVPPESIGSTRKSDEDSLAMWGDEGDVRGLGREKLGQVSRPPRGLVVVSGRSWSSRGHDLKHRPLSVSWWRFCELHLVSLWSTGSLLVVHMKSPCGLHEVSLWST